LRGPTSKGGEGREKGGDDRGGRRRREGTEGRGKGRRGEGGEGRGEEAFLVMWPRRLSALNPPLGHTLCHAAVLGLRPSAVRIYIYT